MVKIWPRMGLCYLYFWLRSLLEAPKWVKDPGYGPQMASPNFPTASKTFFSLEFDLFFFACFDSEGFKAFKFLLTSFFFPLFHCFNSLFVRFSGGSPRLWASALEFLSALLEGWPLHCIAGFKATGDLVRPDPGSWIRWSLDSWWLLNQSLTTTGPGLVSASPACRCNLLITSSSSRAHSFLSVRRWTSMMGDGRRPWKVLFFWWPEHVCYWIFFKLSAQASKHPSAELSAPTVQEMVERGSSCPPLSVPACFHRTRYEHKEDLAS